MPTQTGSLDLKGLKGAGGLAQAAQASANGKNQVFYSSTAPTGGTYKAGDTWFKMGTTLEDATKTGGIVTFDGSGSVKSIVVNIDPVQSGTGDPSPSNIRPITGHDSVNVTRAGKNMLHNSLSTTTKQGLTYTVNSDGSVTVTGTATANSYVAIPINRVFDVDVVISGSPSMTGIYGQIVTSGGNVSDTGSGATVVAGRTITEYRCRINNGVNPNGATFYPMLRLASDTDATFEPYTGTTYPVSFSSAGTVYGGTVDIVSGVLTVDTVTAQIGSYNWKDRIGSQGRVYTLATNILPSAPYVYDSFASLSADGKNLCDKLPMTNTVSNPDSASITIGVNDYIYLNGVTHIDASVTNKTSLNTWLTNNPLQVTFRLATPQTYQLTPAQVTTLVGTNNVWADTGDITVTGTIDTGDAAVEVYQWDGTQWALTPIGSEVFASIDAGKITTGELSAILIRSNSDDYWNLSGVNITRNGKVYKANTLETGHIAARDNIVAIGNDGSGQMEITSMGIRAVSADSGEVMTARSSDVLITAPYVYAFYGETLSAAGDTDTVEIPVSSGEFEAVVEIGIGWKRQKFTVGTGATYTLTANGVTASLVYDATENTLTLTVTANTGTRSARLISCKYNVSYNAPFFTFGTREGEPGGFSIAGGAGLYATRDFQTVLGKYNTEDDGDSADAALIIGNGTQDNMRSDAFRVGWDGDIGFFADAAHSAVDEEIALRLGAFEQYVYEAYGNGIMSLKALLLQLIYILQYKFGSLGFSNDTVINSGATQAVTIPTNSTHLMVVTSGGTAQRGMYMVTCTSANATTSTAMHAVSTLTITTGSSGTISVKNTGSQPVRLNFLTMQGNTVGGPT